ncbi:MAG: hypothetical protein KGZ50_03065 [Peptococcaceae bacterium]|nr:hypothetical protein [Peptococcaceae bacterium]
MRALGLMLATMLIVSLGLFLLPSTGNIPTVSKREAVPYGTALQLAGDARGLISLASAKEEEELVYLLSLQDANGIIAQTPEHMISIPYFSNLAAIAMVGDPRGHAPVLSYMNWYVTHLNRPDKYNVTGTMYDWKQVDGEWIPTYTYDSADSYAATFLSLALQYTRVTGDIEWAKDNLESLLDVAGVLLELQDIDGLIWAKPRYYVKFLMDNAENYRGLRDAAMLMGYLGREDLALVFDTAAGRVAAGMEKHLWLPDKQVYAWALYGRWWARAPGVKWYPDTVSQIYPVVFGVVAPDSPRARSLYAYLNSHYPEWAKGRFDDRFPWTVLSFMAALMQDDTRAVEQLSDIHSANTVRNRSYPWHSFESAFFVKAWRKLATLGRSH